MRHHGYKQIREDHLLLDQAGGSWWIWDPRGEVLVAGKPTKDAKRRTSSMVNGSA